MNDLADTDTLRHDVLVYAGRDDVAAAAADFLRTGRAAGAELFFVAAGRNPALFSSLADGYGGHVTVADLTSQSTDPGRVFGLIRMFVKEHPGVPVHCWQDVGWPGRPAGELTEALRYEALFGRAFAGSPVTILCSYDRCAGDDLIVRAELMHSSVLRDGQRHDVHARGTLDGDEALPLNRPPDDASVLTFREDQVGVRRFAVALARQAGLPASRIADLMLAVGELTANTLVHTNSQGTFAIWVSDGEVVFQVSDTGSISDPMAGTLKPAPTAPGSRRGLWLIHQVADLVETRTGPSGTAVRVHLRLPR